MNQTQGVDAIDVTSAIRAGASNALGLQGFHSSACKFNGAVACVQDLFSDRLLVITDVGDTARMLLQLVLTHSDGSRSTIATGKNWTAMVRFARCLLTFSLTFCSLFAHVFVLVFSHVLSRLLHRVRTRSSTRPGAAVDGRAVAASRTS